ncbi:MAG: hypothetical protein SF051_14055 [Elusimicrobiota bacterium]|nr:hypothetical protein [Elusimicrobiota bacterium]
MKTLKTALALLLAALNASQASANAAARAAGRARVPAPVAAVAPVPSLGSLTLASSLPGPAIVRQTPAPMTPSGASDEAALPPTPAPAPLAGPVAGLAADAPAAAPASGGWIGDFEDVLLHGTDEQRAALSARVAAGEISLQHPGSEAERRALGIIRGVTADWTPRLLDGFVDAGARQEEVPLRAKLSSMLGLNRAVLREAGRRAPGPIERAAFAARALAPEPRLTDDRAAASWLRGQSRRSQGEHRELVELLASRITGARADRAVYGSQRLRAPDHWHAGGTFFWELTEDGAPSPGFVTVNRTDDANFARVIAHEFTHQGDPGAVLALRAMELLYGSPGEALGRAVLEGYTELRARRQMARLREEGLAAASGPSRRYVEALRRVHGTQDDARAWEAEQARFAAHPYQPFIIMVEDLLSNPGGEKALEAFVKRGETTPLTEVLGEERLSALLLALTEPDAGLSERGRKAYSEMAFSYLFRAWLPYVMDGLLDEGRIKDLQQQALAAAALAEMLMRDGAAKEWQLARLSRAGVMPALSKAVGIEALYALVQRAMGARPWDFIPRPRNPRRAALLYAAAPTAGLLLAGLAAGWWFAPLGALGAFLLADAWNAAMALRAPYERINMLLDATRVEAGGRP